MGDGLKLNKDKRHRSSSSMAGVVLEGTRSERKIEIRPSIIEIDDQFTLADAKCDDLQEKIDLIKGLKKKKKLKKRSMTRVTDQQQPLAENAPFITVRTQPKKKSSQQADKLRRMKELPNPFRGYLDPATVEQHRMIGQVRGYSHSYTSPEKQDNKHQQSLPDSTTMPRLRPRRARADGDSMYGRGRQANVSASLEVGCGADDLDDNVAAEDRRFEHQYDHSPSITGSKKLPEARQERNSTPINRGKHVPRDVPQEEPIRNQKTGDARGSHGNLSRRQQNNTRQNNPALSQPEDRPVVEIFNKFRSADSRKVKERMTDKNKRVYDCEDEDEVTSHLEDMLPRPEIVKEEDVHRVRHPRKVKYRSRRYELPTVASQMKQAGVRYYYGTTNQTNIPFIVSKSTAPSHNIGVNIQQVLNGLKIQQPLSGIPLTIAHHMGLGHIPTYDNKSSPVRPALDNKEINAIRLGRRLLRLPSYKYMSYNRLLNLYREGDGMVPRFLRAISRPHYFYTSMYNLATQREDFDGATSKGHGGNKEAKQSLAEYASLYREYEKIDKYIKEGNYEPELERRKEEVARELATREEHIRRVVQEYRSGTEVVPSTLRASASIAEDGYRYSTFKLNLRDAQQ